MAYLAVVSVTRKVVSGREHTIISVVETGVVDNSHEFSFEVPRTGLGNVRFARSTLVASGAGATATTIDPQLAESTGGAAFWLNGAAAASTRSSPDERFEAPLLWGKSMSNGNIGATGSITTTYVLTDGHAA